jgi:hypothetical protein
MYFSFQTQARPMVFDEPELIAMRYHLDASFLPGQLDLSEGYKMHSHVFLDTRPAF